MGTVEEQGKERERERLIKEVVGRLGLYRNWDRYNEGAGQFSLWNRDSSIDQTLTTLRLASILAISDVSVTDWDHTTLLAAWMEAMGIPCKVSTLANVIKFRDWLLKPVPLPKEERGKEAGKGPFSIKEKERNGDGHGSE